MARICFFIIMLSLLLFTIAKEDSQAKAQENEKVPSVKKVQKKKKSAKDWNAMDFNNLEKQWEEGDDEAEKEAEFTNSERIMKRKTMEAREKRLKAEKSKKAANKKAASKTKTKKKGSKRSKAADDDTDEYIPPPPGFEHLESQAIGPGGGNNPPPPGLEGFNMNDLEAGGMLNDQQSQKDMGPQMWFIDMQMTQMQGPDKGKRWTRKALDKLAALWAEMLKTAHLSANMYVLGEYKNDPETKEETGPTMLVSLDKAWQEKEITKFIATKPDVLKLTKDRKTLTALNFMYDDDDDDEL